MSPTPPSIAMADAGDDASSTGSNDVVVTEEEIRCVPAALAFASSALLAAT